MEYVIETQGLSKSFGSLQAVREVSLRVEPGETYGLLGPNGSGKTTLMRMLVGLVRPTRGTGGVLGEEIPPDRVLSRIGYMTQAGALYQELTVGENVAFFGALSGVTSKERIQEVIALVGLEDRAKSTVGTLSGGLKQRASLACALVHNPQLLILDEPTVGVDPQLRSIFWDHFRKLNQQGVTILVSSHVMDEAARCTRLGLMREGSLLAEGSPGELKSQAGTGDLEGAFLKIAGGSHA
ncbi:MAG: ABC transporter ATP-binding protein [Chloroflexi bacterium]|nr:ABC transporter ATP-binding protein [Chloroflexota bacterium]